MVANDKNKQDIDERDLPPPPEPPVITSHYGPEKETEELEKELEKERQAKDAN